MCNLLGNNNNLELKAIDILDGKKIVFRKETNRQNLDCLYFCTYLGKSIYRMKK